MDLLRRLRIIPFALMVGAMLLVVAPQRTSAQTDQRCFPETNQCISGRIREFWEQNGGLPVFGLPITDQHEEMVEGKPFQVQWFERNRLELHPENARPYDVLLGRLGVDRLQQQGRDWFQFPKSAPQNGCRYFAETGHNICGDILKAWHANGLEIDGKRGKSEAENLALFGLPLSDQMVEDTPNGSFTVQHFERARFELHPENQPPFNVLLGLLGNEIRGNGGSPPPPPPPPADACTDVPDPVSARIRPSKCVKKGVEIEIDIFGFEPNEQVGFWLTAPDGSIAGTRRTLSIGPQGAVNGIPFPTDGLDPGIWYFVFQGVSTNHQSIAYFKITETAPPPGPPSGPPPAVPPGQDAVVTPDHGPRGTLFRIVARGFKPGEAVGIYDTRPDQSVGGAPFQEQADANGVTGVQFQTRTDSPTGIWAITFEGVETHHKAIAYFLVTE
jgi:hypothetical protein